MQKVQWWFCIPKHFIVSYRNKGIRVKNTKGKNAYMKGGTKEMWNTRTEGKEEREKEQEKEQEKFWARIAEILKDEEEEETSAADKSRTFVSLEAIHQR